MYTYNPEETIGFHLTKVKGAAAKGKEDYRAVLDHNGLSADETLAELVKETGIPPAQLTYIASSVLNGLVTGTLRAAWTIRLHHLSGWRKGIRQDRRGHPHLRT